MATKRSWIFETFVIGLIILTPILLLAYILQLVLIFSDTFLFNFLPANLHPEQLLGFKVPGLGILTSIGIIFVTGILARNYIGNALFSQLEKLISKVPVAKGVYQAFKQFTMSIFGSGSSKSFSKVVLIEYPRERCYTLAFVTNENTQILNRTDNLDLRKPASTVFVPTTPNPTSGFLLIIPKEDIIEVDMKVDEAFKLVISGGVISPEVKEDFLTKVYNDSKRGVKV